MSTVSLTHPDRRTIIVKPGVYDIPDDAYHADPFPGGSLSSSGARRLLPPSCPAIFRHEQQFGRPDKAAFDFGHAAHKLVLGVGPLLFAVDANDWRTNAAKAQRDEIRAAGGVPLLAAEMVVVEEMAQALLDHPIASKLLAPTRGRAEVSLFWPDDRSGVMRRCRLDWLPNWAPGRMVIPDYKTALSADPEHFAKTAANYGYHQQADWNTAGVQSLGLADDVAFVFIVQEKTAPYLITVIELDSEALRIGHRLNRQALDLYAHCVATDTWPGYADDVVQVPLPAWYERAHQEDM